MRILITGCNGQVGVKLKEICIDNSISFIALSKEQMDITQKSEILQAVQTHQPSIIINAAAYTNVDLAEDEEDKAFEVNALGPKNLAEICFDNSLLLIHISTDYVFDGKKNSPYEEEDKPEPLNIYGKSKLVGENNIRFALDRYVIFRTSWVFSDTGKNFVGTILRLAGNSNSLKIVGDQLGSPTSAQSISEAIIRICESYQSSGFRYGTYHFSSQESISWFEFAEVIADLAYKKGLINDLPNIIKIKSEEYPSKSIKPKYSSMSSYKIQKTFGITPNNWRLDLRNLISQLSD